MSFGEEYLKTLLEKVSNLSNEEYLKLHSKAKLLRTQNSILGTEYCFSGVAFYKTISNSAVFLKSVLYVESVSFPKTALVSGDSAFPASEDLSNAA